MRYFIAYATVEGQTRKIAEQLAAELNAGGDRVSIMNVSDLYEYTLERPDGIILCAPIHANHYPAAFADFVRREAEWLNAIPAAFVSVSLSIISDAEEERQEVRDVAATLCRDSGWTPALTHHAAGALRYGDYDFFKRWMAKRLASRRGAPVDASRDWEFTDWRALTGFLADFVRLTRATTASG